MFDVGKSFEERGSKKGHNNDLLQRLFARDLCADADILELTDPVLRDAARLAHTSWSL